MEVLNKRTCVQGYHTHYIGRPSKWGNPFSHLDQKTLAAFKVATREEAVASYREWILNGDGSYLLDDLDELRDKDLVCWCAPEACHGDVLKELVELSALTIEELAQGYSVLTVRERILRGLAAKEDTKPNENI